MGNPALLPACSNAWLGRWKDTRSVRVADHFLDPNVRDQVNAMLQTDQTAATDIPHKTTCADKCRDSDRTSAEWEQRPVRNDDISL